MPEWKTSGKLAFGQVPLLQDGEFNVVQSNTIARYLARKFDLYGDAKTGAISDMIIDGHNDFLQKIIPAIYPTFDAEKLATVRAEVFPGFMNAFEKILSDFGGDGFLGGEKLTLGDLALFLLTESYIFEYKMAAPDAYPKLSAHKEKVEANENIAKYLASDKRFPPRKLG